MPRSKLTVKVWCLPVQTEEQLKCLHQVLVAALVSVDIGVKGENDIIVLFPPDMMAYGLGSEILIEVTHLPSRKGMKPATIKWCVAYAVKTVVEQCFPHAHVQGSFLRAEDFPDDVESLARE